MTEAKSAQEQMRTPVSEKLVRCSFDLHLKFREASANALAEPAIRTFAIFAARISGRAIRRS